MRDPTEALVDLIWRVPVLAIDVPAAQRAGDAAAVAYAAAIAAWRAEAAQAVAAAMSISPCQGRHAVPDAFARILSASALTQQAAE